MKKQLIRALLFAVPLITIQLVSGASAFAADCSSPDTKWSKPFSKGPDSVYSGEIISVCTFGPAHVINAQALALKLMARDAAEAVPGSQVQQSSNGPTTFSLQRTIKLDGSDHSLLNQRTTIQIQGTMLNYSSQTLSVSNPSQLGVTFVKRETYFVLDTANPSSAQLSFKSNMGLKKDFFVPEGKLIPRTSHDLAQAQLDEVNGIVNFLNKP